MKENDRWMMFSVLMLCAVTIGIDQLKISAIMSESQQWFRITGTQAAFLTSIFTVAGVLLAVPGAFLQRYLGPKKLLLLLMGCLVVGSAGGAISHSYWFLCAVRMLEGVSYAMIIMNGLTLIRVWFGKKGVGIATGIFNTFAAVANFIAMNLLPYTARMCGVRGVWILLSMVSGVCLLLVLGIVKEPEKSVQLETEPNVKFHKLFSDAEVNLLAIAQAGLGFVLFAFITCYPQLFSSYYGLDAQTANFYTSLNGLFGIFCCAGCGMLIEKSSSAYLPAIAGSLGTVLLCLFIPYLKEGMYVPHVFMSALFPGGLGMTAIFCIAPIAGKKERAAGDSLSVINMMYYIGVFASTPVVTVLARYSWKAAAFLMVAVSAVSLIALLILYIFYDIPKRKAELSVQK